MGNWGGHNCTATSKPLSPIFFCMGLLNRWGEWFRCAGNFPWPNDSLGSTARLQAFLSCMECNDNRKMVHHLTCSSPLSNAFTASLQLPYAKTWRTRTLHRISTLQNCISPWRRFLQKSFYCSTISGLAPKENKVNIHLPWNIAYLNTVSTEYSDHNFLAKLFCRVTCTTAAASSCSYMAAFQQYLKGKRLPVIALHQALGFSQVAVIISLYGDTICVFSSRNSQCHIVSRCVQQASTFKKITDKCLFTDLFNAMS